MRDAEFHHPRLVEVYDAQNGWAVDDDFFLSLMGVRPGSRVLDLGCGSGRLALGLARAGHEVTAVDPATTLLDAAPAKPGADAVTWIDGTSSVLPDRSFEAAVMTSHVAQFIVDDEWAATLADLSRALVPGGTLAFDSRDPVDRIWERWNPMGSRRELQLDGGETVTTSMELTGVAGEHVTVELRFRFGDGVELTSRSTLRFRSEETLRSSLHDAGFTVDAVYGGWQRQPVGQGDGELIFTAKARVIGLGGRPPLVGLGSRFAACAPWSSE